jgi:hypothetical protein
LWSSIGRRATSREPTPRPTPCGRRWTSCRLPKSSTDGPGEFCAPATITALGNRVVVLQARLTNTLVAHSVVAWQRSWR